LVKGGNNVPTINIDWSCSRKKITVTVTVTDFFRSNLRSLLLFAHATGLSKKCNFHCNQKDKPDRFVRLRYCSVPSNNKIKQTVPQMVPFCRIFVTPLEGHVHLCDTNPFCERFRNKTVVTTLFHYALRSWWISVTDFFRSNLRSLLLFARKTDLCRTNGQKQIFANLDKFISRREEIWTHKTNLTTQLHATFDWSFYAKPGK
jgi:hypothetical protein